jgi:hypothetical protein
VLRTRIIRLLLGMLAALILLGAASTAASAKQRLFRSPSHNVACLYSSSGGPGPFIRCDVLSLNDVGYFLRTKHRAKRSHVTDTVNNPDKAKTLRYGRKRRFGRYTCKSARSGLKCVNRRNHHGFKLSRAHQKVF